ncbi:oxidoreductase C-terminal domain-containing protein [Streptomyces flavidovirens]|uniref:oxidoreductase C-terminal domain-containing protein n=1 Tax=Streptomyces flavidovirens TaxID=67298 RepID=UPI003F557F5B
MRITDGSPEERSFLAVYERPDGTVTAVLALNRPRAFMRLRRELSSGVPAGHGSRSG